jgi:hypothetical protein
MRMDELAFDAAMMNLHVRARDELGYNATRYVQMLLNHRGMETARILINATQPSQGFTFLWEQRRLDLTVEYLVLQPEWQSLFAQEPELLEQARRRLAKYDFNV